MLEKNKIFDLFLKRLSVVICQWKINKNQTPDRKKKVREVISLIQEIYNSAQNDNLKSNDSSKYSLSLVQFENLIEEIDKCLIGLYEELEFPAKSKNTEKIKGTG